MFSLAPDDSTKLPAPVIRLQPVSSTAPAGTVKVPVTVSGPLNLITGVPVTVMLRYVPFKEVLVLTERSVAWLTNISRVEEAPEPQPDTPCTDRVPDVALPEKVTLTVRLEPEMVPPVPL